MLFSIFVALLSITVQSVLAAPSHHHRHVAQHKRAKASAQSDTPKYVVAHHMVGNTYPYTQDDWIDDIVDAFNAGIDGFALNIGPEEWQHSQARAAYKAGKKLLDTNKPAGAFKLFFSFDMAVLPGGSAADAVLLRNLITEFYNHPNQFKYKGKSFASTFSGQDSTFGHASSEEGWLAEFTGPLEASGNGVHFVPAFFVPPERMAGYKAAQGAFSWTTGWIVEPRLPLPPGEGLPSGTSPVTARLGSIGEDRGIIDAVKPRDKTYMAPVSPWFYTHYGKQSFDKNWVYVAEFGLYSKRWESLVENRDSVDLVEIITWNDYGESSYIGPIKGAQPNSQAWVDDMDHFPWLLMTKHFATAFKTGQYPEITEDEVFLVARPHTKNAECSDPVPKPKDFDLLTDSLFATVFTRAPATVILSTSGSQSKTFQVKAGVNRLNVPLTVGGYIRAQVIRDGKATIDFKPEGFTFTDRPKTYNYNAFVAHQKESDSS